MAEKEELIVPAMIKVRKIARLTQPCIEIPLFLSKRIEAGEEALFSYHETENEKIIKLIFKKEGK